MSEQNNASTEAELERIRHVYANYNDAGLSERLWSAENPGNQAIVRERMAQLRELSERTGFLPLTDRQVLDVGCGNGDVLVALTAWGARPANLQGIDLLPERVAAARIRHPDLHIQQGNAERLTFADASFDLVIFFTVFSSILDPTMRHNVAGEAIRVLKPGGAIVWYDFRYRNPRNLNTRPLTRSDISELFPGFTPHLSTVTLLPPLARRLGPLTPSFYPILSAIPLLRTHFLGLLVKPASTTARKL